MGLTREEKLSRYIPDRFQHPVAWVMRQMADLFRDDGGFYLKGVRINTISECVIFKIQAVTPVTGDDGKPAEFVQIFEVQFHYVEATCYYLRSDTEWLPEAVKEMFLYVGIRLPATLQ